MARGFLMRSLGMLMRDDALIVTGYRTFCQPRMSSGFWRNWSCSLPRAMANWAL